MSTARVPSRDVRKSAADLEDVLCCPITLQLLKDPHQCPHCQQNASYEPFIEYVAQHERCFMCHEALSLQTEGDAEGAPKMSKNHLVAAVIEKLLPLLQAVRAPDGMVHHEGMLYEYTEPFKVLVTGAMGVGKSALINALHQEATEADAVVSPEGSGAHGTTKEFQCVVENQTYKVKNKEIRVSLFDSPGFNDPELPHAELMCELNKATQEMALGLDALIHVIRKGRLTEADRCLPSTLMAALAGTEEQRVALLKRWIIVVTHSDSGRKPVQAERLQEFRGEMKGAFPDFMEQVVSDATFVELNLNRETEYSDMTTFKDELFTRITKCREVGQRCFRTAKLDHVIAGSLKAVMAHYPDLRKGLEHMKKEELTSLYRFLVVVSEKKRWLEITDSILPDDNAFRDMWNKLNIAARDTVAMQVAKRVKEDVHVQAHKSWMSFVYETNSSSSKTASKGDCSLQ